MKAFLRKSLKLLQKVQKVDKRGYFLPIVFYGQKSDCLPVCLCAVVSFTKNLTNTQFSVAETVYEILHKNAKLNFLPKHTV